MDNNTNIEYDLSYLILKDNKILGFYDDSEITPLFNFAFIFL